MAFRFDKLTVKAQEAVQASQDRAADAGNPQIEPLHLLAGLIAESDGLVRPTLDRIGVKRQQLSDLTAAEMNRLPKVSGGARPGVSAALQKVFDASAAAADQMKDEFVSTEHLLLALLRDRLGGPAASRILAVTVDHGLRAESAAASFARRPALWAGLTLVAILMAFGLAFVASPLAGLSVGVAALVVLRWIDRKARESSGG